MQRLRGRVAIVTGASRNVGRGIATVLGEEGATVYVTGRSTRERGPTPISPPTIRSSGTIEETAEMVTARGGTGIPVRVDHTVDAEVEALFDRVRLEQGYLDLLVNNAWGGYENFESFSTPFWEQPLWRFDAMVTTGPRTESTEYIGRAVTALAVDPNVMSRSGQILTAGGVASEYGFTDVDGRLVPPTPFRTTAAATGHDRARMHHLPQQHLLHRADSATARPARSTFGQITVDG